MKHYYFLFFLVFLTSCSVDEFSPCEEAEGMDDLLCKEFRFENDASIGYLAYYYSSDRILSRREYKTEAGQLKKYDTFEYTDGKITAERSYNEKGDLLREKEYGYDASSNLSSVKDIEGGVEVAEKLLEYEDTLLMKESNYAHSQLENYIVYQYYNDEVKVYRTSLYSASGQLTSYTNIEYFVNNHERHKHYSGNHDFTGYDVYDYNENANITQFSSFDSSGKLTSHIEYTYNGEGQLDRSEEFDEDGDLRKKTIFIYHQ